MRISVFLAFSAFLIPSLGLTKEAVTVSCPSEFHTKTENNKSLSLAGMETWANGIELAMPTLFRGKKVDVVFDKDHTEIRCQYDAQHQISIEVPKGTLYCTGSGPVGGKRKMFCMGPKEAVPTSPPPTFISQPVDYSATLQGFGLRQTVEQIIAEAQRQGLSTQSREEPLPDKSRRTRVEIASTNPITVLFSPLTKLSTEVRQDFKRNGDPNSDFVTQGQHSLGSFNDVNVPTDLIWDRKAGVIVIGRDITGKSSDNYLRLIDDAEVSKESGKPLGYKKYVGP